MQLFDEDKIKAVAYYRHSAEDKQENSVSIQREQVERFAEREQVQILEHFQDEGISGLTAHRPGFQEMFSKWVTGPDAQQVDYIIVYDASRFGRFQEMSEVWRWLGLCNERGIKLATVTRGLPKNETSVIDSFIITLDFSMSGEFSKVLSDKVAYGSMKVAEQGYSAGGTAPYGYVRVLLSEQRERLGILQQGEHKIISNQRVTFEPAQDGSADIVKRIYKEFVTGGLFFDDIAQGLNEDDIKTATGRSWNASGVVRVLSNETYTGTRVYNKTWGRLKHKKRNNPPHEWVRCLDAHEALVDTDTFQKAQERLYWLRPRSRNYATYRIHKAQTYLSRYLEEVIADFTDDQKHYIRRHIPISFGANYSMNDKQRTCFYIPPQKSNHDEHLLCAVNTLADDVGVQSIYKVGSGELGSGGFTVIEDGSSYLSLDQEQLKDTLVSLANRVIGHHAPWLTNTSRPLA